MLSFSRRVRLAARSAYATTVWTTAAFALVMGVSGVVATRALGPYERGLLATALVWGSMLELMTVWGAQQGAAYFVARDRDRPPRSAATVAAVAGIPGAALAAIGAVSALLLIPGAAASPMAITLGAALPRIIAGAFLGTVLGLGEYRNYGVLRLVSPALMLVGVIVATQSGWRSAVAVTTVIAAAALLQLAVLWAVLRRRGLLGRPSRSLMRPVAAYIWRNVLSGTAWWVCYELTLMILTLVVSPERVGVYAVSMSFGAIIMMVASAASQVMLTRASSGGAASVRASLPKALVTCLVVAGGVGAVMFATVPVLVPLLFGPEFDAVVTPARILLLGAAALSVTTVLTDTLRGLGVPLVPARAELLGAAATLVLLPGLLTAAELAGAAIASTVGYTTVMAIMAIMLRTEMRKQAKVPDGPAESPRSATRPKRSDPGPCPPR